MAHTLSHRYDIAWRKEETLLRPLGGTALIGDDEEHDSSDQADRKPRSPYYARVGQPYRGVHG